MHTPTSDLDLLEAIVRSATDYAIISLDKRNRVLTWSAGAAALLGWHADEICGQSGAVIFTPEDQEKNAPEQELTLARTHGRAEDERWHLRKDGSRFWGSGVMVPLKPDAPPGFVKIIRDRTRERQAAVTLRQSEQRFRSLVENIPQLVWCSDRLGNRTWGSPQWEIFSGLTLEQSVGHGWLEAIHPADRELTLEAWHEAERTGTLDVEHRTRRAADGEYRWFRTRGTRFTKDEGMLEWMGTSTDVHDLRRALERQHVLIRELHHRTRNLLGVVNAITHQTLSRSRNVEEFADRFYNRIAALGRVHSLVARADEVELALRELIETEIMAHATDADQRIVIAGPPVALNEKASETLGLAVHELATNAVKYGALASPTGKLHVSWSIDEGPLVLDWRETGLEAPPQIANRGYGRELIEVALPFALGAQTRWDCRPNGIECRIELPEYEWRADRSKASTARA
jgi:PAS domain S-box-containing protein